MKRILPVLGIWAAPFLGMILFISGISKVSTQSGGPQPLLNPELLPTAFYFFFPPLNLISYVEIAIGLLLILGVAVKVVTSVSALMITCFAIDNILLISQGLAGEPCGCFGMGQRLTVIDSLFLDGVMVGLAVTILILYPGRCFNKRPWFWGK